MDEDSGWIRRTRYLGLGPTDRTPSGCGLQPGGHGPAAGVDKAYPRVHDLTAV